MFARAKSGTIIGVKAHSVVVEAHRGKGLPGLTLIGLARGAVRESAVRVRSAILASDITLGTQRTVVNLLPAELPKEASALDLPLAVALLAASGVIPLESLENKRFFGELSLGGTLEPVRGGVLVADLVREQGEQELILPHASAAEASVIPGFGFWARILSRMWSVIYWEAKLLNRSNPHNSLQRPRNIVCLRYAVKPKRDELWR